MTQAVTQTHFDLSPMRYVGAAAAAPLKQRGAAALIVTMMLFFAMVLVAVFVNRNLVFEQRSSANQYRSTQAFEAAEAGLEWAQAQLNHSARIGPDCLATTDPAASSFRTHYLQHVANTASFVPVDWNQAGVATALQPSCVRHENGWSCSCPPNGPPVLAAPGGNRPAPAFTLKFEAGAKPGVVHIVATGCARLAGACVPGAAMNADAIARVHVDLGLIGGLRTLPAAAITTRGAFDAGGAAIGVHNPDPASGIAIHAGGPIAAAQARLGTPAGAALDSALVGHDAALAALGEGTFFASYFGLDKASWKRQPGVVQLDCAAGCTAALSGAIASSGNNAMVWIDGDLALSGPVVVGSPEHPVLIVVNGEARLDGAVQLHGLIYSRSLSWNHTSGSPAVLRGAAISETHYSGTGAPELFYDAGQLARLKAETGSFVRIAGSWRDF